MDDRTRESNPPDVGPSRRCLECGMDILGDSDEESARFYQLHLNTFQHQAGKLGEAGREFLRALAVERDRLLRRLGVFR